MEGVKVGRRSTVVRNGFLLLSGVLVGLFCWVLTSGSANAAPGDYGIEEVSASRTTSQAGAHPDLTTTIAISTDPSSPEAPDGSHKPYGSTQDLGIELPQGMTGNPRAVVDCSELNFATALSGEGCPLDSQVGVTVLYLGFPVPIHEPVYNLAVPPGSDDVARLGFYALVAPVVLRVRIGPENSYRVTTMGRGFASSPALVKAVTTLWGVPADESHDTERFSAGEVFGNPFTTESPPRKSGLERFAFLTNPRRCGSTEMVRFSVDSYQDPGNFVSAEAALPPTTGCELLQFTPDAFLQPTTTQADSPSGMDVELKVDQTALTNPNTNAPADLKSVTTTLPQGMSLNPAAANGLGACSEAQVGLIEEVPPRFNRAAVSCPDSSRVGSAKIISPVLDKPIEGSLYVATPRANPFHSLLAGYLVAQDEGVMIKLAGRFDLDPATGQFVATFDQNPQQPFSSLSLHFKGGESGVLVTPPRCGTHQIETDLAPWSAADPDNPTADEIVHRISPFEITAGPDGGPCPDASGFAPGFEAGSVTPMAGAYSPLVVRASRPDGSQTLTGIDVKLPPGLVATLSGIPYCPATAIAAAAGRTGADEAASPSCPADSRLGSVDVGAGAGSSPVHVQGSVYLSGPYKGAPLSLAVVTPAVAGPFDLGTVVVRAAIYVDPLTAQVHAVSDSLPTILEGVPLHIRSVEIRVDRTNFARTPTSCDPMQAEATLFGAPDMKTLVSRYQVGGCDGLDFKPKLSLRLKGGTKRGNYPALRAVLQARSGEANIERVSVALPHSEFLAQEHINTICTRVQFAASNCPRGSVYGYAKVSTPLLEEPLKGPVYLRSSSHKLPDLVADLRGQIDINLVGRIDSVNDGIRTTFNSVPDAPVKKFVLKMKGGKKSLLVNSTDICESKSRAVVKMDGQNGKVHDSAPLLRAPCGSR
jgi:hypothetical protein